MTAKLRRSWRRKVAFTLVALPAFFVAASAITLSIRAALDDAIAWRTEMEWIALQLSRGDPQMR